MTRRFKLLLVEDDPADARMIREILTDAGGASEIVHHTRIAAAIEALATESFDAMLLDLTLPDAEGVDTVRRAKAAAPHLPIVVMTGAGDDALAAAAVGSGAQDYLEKGVLEPALLTRSISYAVERGKAMRALYESEERYALAVQGANDGLWDWRLSEDRIYFSERWKSMLGYEGHEVDDSAETWFGRIHEADVDEVKRALADHVQGRADAFEVEYRMRHKGGGWVWMLTRGLAVRNARGEAYRIAGSQTDVTKRKEVEQRLRHHALHDELTELPNRALLLDRLARAILRREQHDAAFALVAVGLDNLRSIDDSFGHAVADQWLRSVAELLAGFIGPEDTLARIARSEFVLLYESRPDIGSLLGLAERIQTALQRPMAVDDEELFSSASIGIVLADADRDRPEDYLRDAGVAMSRAKSLGGGQHRVFDAPMHHFIVERLKLEKELRQGIDKDEFVMRYQPIVALGTGEVAGFEALLRWNHPRRGLLPPHAFLEVAESAGLIGPIFDRVFPTVLEQQSLWQTRFRRGTPLFVNVNLSRAQLADGRLCERLDVALARQQITRWSLGFEMTESMMVDDERVLATLRALKGRGVRLLLDDFGTGYSSLASLKLFPIDSLKIDKSFLAGLGSPGDSAEIIRAIVTLAHSMAMEVTVEGIETEDQLRFVSNLGCEYGQGYYFAVPLEPEAATDAIARGFRVTSPPPSSRQSPREERSRGRVLVVDDDRPSRNLMRLLLEEEGFEVVTAANGHEAIELASSSSPEVIVLDLVMPGMDGIETCRRLKRSAETSPVPVVFVTGRNEDDPTTIEALNAGGNDFVSKDTPRPVLCARLESQVAIARAQSKLRTLAMTDELTGMYSRRFMFQALRRTLKASTRRDLRGMATLLVDVDDFKSVNDRHGHIEGDRVLREIARFIDGATRETDLVARFGGEEFVVVLADTDPDGARIVAEKIRAAVQGQCGITISIGGAYLAEARAEDLASSAEIDRIISELLRRADAAMYAAKRHGKNRVVFADDADALIA
jgi:diguanylate cyclase (GGDEF)-like protein/PAS domain S-box-containing protein